MNFVTLSWVDLDGFLDVSRRHDYRASEQLPRRCIHPNTTQLFKIFENYPKKKLYKCCEGWKMCDINQPKADISVVSEWLFSIMSSLVEEVKDNDTAEGGGRRIYRQS